MPIVIGLVPRCVDFARVFRRLCFPDIVICDAKPVCRDELHGCSQRSLKVPSVFPKQPMGVSQCHFSGGFGASRD